MRVSSTLNRVIFGQAVVDGQTSGALELLASSGVSAEEGLSWCSAVSLEPLSAASPQESQAVGVFNRKNGDFIFARAQNQNEIPVYELIALPGEVLHQLAGDLSPLLTLVESPLPVPLDETLSALEIPHLPTWTLDKRTTFFKRFLDEMEDMRLILRLLGAVLDARGLTITGYAGDYRQRAALAQALMMLLPSSARTELTFSTHTVHLNTPVRLIFNQIAQTVNRHVADFAAGVFPDDTVLQLPYVEYLHTVWQGDPAAFMAALKPLELIAPYLMKDKLLIDGLTEVAARAGFDAQILLDETPPVAALKAVLTSSAPPQGDLQIRYVDLLLGHSLTQRDAEAALIVTRYMDAHPAVEAALNDVLNDALAAEPDSVYVLARTRLSEGIDERWLSWLQAAAVFSLKVALTDGDSATLFNWLKLIAREPITYGLGDILHEGILAAQIRAREDGVLGCQLISLAVKRDNKAIDLLLNDPQLMALLPDEPLGLALREHESDSIFLLQNQGRELFLVALARASQAKASAAFTPATIGSLWRIYTGGQAVNLPPHYQPEGIIQQWIEDGIDWLSTETLETLLTLILASARDDIFYQLSHHLSENQVLFPLLSVVLQRSGRSVTDVLGLVGQMVTAGDLNHQQAVNTYIALLAAWEWKKETLPLVEQMARVVQQSPAKLTITSEVCWHLLEIAAEFKNELVARIASKRLLNYLELLPGEAEIVDQLLRLRHLTQWNAPFQNRLLSWWREFARKQSLVNLQQFDKALEGKRPLEDARSVIQTVIALRKMLGKRSLDDFSEDISTTFTILQALVDAFDPPPKHAFDIDQETLRNELDARKDELSPEKRKLLAKNLKELALLITEMAENRTKTPLMRREEDFERQLITGEHQPQSAVDTMKWLYGYWDGAQQKSEESGE